MSRPYRRPGAAYAVPRPRGPVAMRLADNEGQSPPGTDPSLARYPDASPLQADLAARYGVAPEQVVVTAGADDALGRAFTALVPPGGAVVLAEPTFSMLRRFAEAADRRVASVPWRDGPFPVTEVVRQARAVDADAVALVSPNNPTGAVASPADLTALHEALPHTWLWVDAAYGEFARTDLTPTALRLPRAVVFRTLSKAWGLAGLRVGFALGPVAAIDALRAVGGPYPCSTPSLRLARQVVGDDTAMTATVEAVARGRERLGRTLTELGADPAPSQANFVLARFGSPARASWVADALAGLGLAVRAFPTVADLDDALRITVPPTLDAQDRLDEALRTALAPQALLFDVDGVLIDTTASYDAAILATAAELGVTLSTGNIAERRARGDANNDWVVCQQLLASRGVVRPLDVVRDAFEAQMDAGLWRQERALPILRTLPEGLPLALVTGRPRRDLERTLQHLDLTDRFAVSVCMGDAPAKPSPQPVERALEQLGVQRAWMLGDTPDDVVAARQAGVVPLAVAPEGTAPAWVDALWRAGAARVADDAVQALQGALPWIR